MPTDSLVVILEGRPIGRIEREAHKRLRLVYDAAQVETDDTTPLSVSMTPIVEVHAHAAITPWLWGLLPENDAVLRRWGRQFDVSVSSPFPLLGTQVGHDCAGAVQFARPADVQALVDRTGDLICLTEADVAARIRQLREDDAAWLGPGFTGQFSLAGAQAKTALHRADGRWALPTGSVPTTHILKPAVVGFEAQDLNEHLCLSAARHLGLPAARTAVERFEDQTAIVIDRYDRLAEQDGTISRIHQEDLCQATATHPADKYQADGGPTPRRIADVLRGSMPGPRAVSAVRGLADALIFNWLVAGTDAHAKNYSLLLSGSQVRLAPLYDITSYLPYDRSSGHDVKLAMKVGGEYRLLRIDRPAHWQRTARDLGLHPGEVLARAIDLAGRIDEAFGHAAADPTVAELGSDLPDQLTELVAGRAARCRQDLE